MGKRRRKNRERFLEIAEAYRDTASPRCPHFGTCGGCLFQDISYENQLELKRLFLNEACSGVLPELTHINSAPQAFRYRNRMDFVAAFDKRGLRKRGSFKEVFDISQCPIMQLESDTLWQEICETLHEIEDYNYLDHYGFLRYTILRQAYFTKEIMLNFVIARDDKREVFESLVENLGDKVSSSSLLLNDTLTDTSYAPILHTLRKGTITESFDEVGFEIGPNTFFQSNSQVALTMYKKIREFVQGRVLDLYCGVGTISLFVANACEHVTGVEIVEDSILSAHKNKAANKITNADFIAADARPFMRENQNKFDTLIMDPPRSGINPRMYKYIASLAPKRIIYMSCNPVTFRSDYEFLREYYQLDYYEAFDMFPQTPHAESLALLTKK